MNVLIIGSRIPWPLHDGGAIATYNLLKGLSEASHKVTYLSLNTSRHFVDETTIQREFAFLSKIETQFINTDVKILNAFLNLFSSESYNIGRFYDPAFGARIRNELMNHSYNLIHFEGLYVAKYAREINMEVKIPMILRQHNIEFKIWQNLASECRNILKRNYFRLLAIRLKNFEIKVQEEFLAVVCITGEDSNYTIEKLHYKGIAKTIPAGIYIKNEPAIVSDTFNLYHIGSMEWLPNREAMEWFHNDIWPILESAHPGIQFYMAGKNMPEQYKTWETNAFHVAGEVPDLDEFTKDKDIMVVPLKSGSGIRIKTIEAMISCKTVVSTSLGAKGLPLTNNEHCLIADSATGFAECISKLIKDPELRKRLAENGRTLAVGLYGNSSVTKQWLEFYAEIIKNGKLN